MALASLEAMRAQGESIALLYHATGIGKTVTAVSDAKRLGKRTLFLAHTKELITQAKGTFEELHESSYRYQKRMETLLKEGAKSKSDYENAQTSLAVSQNDMTAAKAAYDMALEGWVLMTKGEQPL